MKGAGLLATDEDVVNDLIGYLVLLKISMASDQNHDIFKTGNIELQVPDILDHARDFN